LGTVKDWPGQSGRFKDETRGDSRGTMKERLRQSGKLSNFKKSSDSFFFRTMMVLVLLVQEAA
jgi:hypothetical protein